MDKPLSRSSVLRLIAASASLLTLPPAARADDAEISARNDF